MLLVERGVADTNQIRREGPTPNILSTEGGREMPELARQLSDMLVADTAGIEKGEEEEEEAEKEMEVGDDDAKWMNDKQLLDPELIDRKSVV